MIPKETFTGDSSCNSRDLPYRISIASRSYGSKSGQTMLVRCGTSSVRMAAISIAKKLGLTVFATARNKDKIDAIRNNGAEYVIVDNRQIASELKQQLSRDDDNSADGVSWFFLQLIGTVTLLESMQAGAPKETVCNTGILGNEWVIKNFMPNHAINFIMTNQFHY
jgi:NADPH:quinone reductase